MGINRLIEVIKMKAPNAIKLNKISKYKGWRVGIDGSMVIYQTLIAIRYGKDTLKNENNEGTSHLQGILYKCINLLEKGISPLFVFDGVPPEIKGKTLQERKEKKEEAQRQAEAAEGKEEEKYLKRTVKMTSYHVESTKELLSHLGIPHVTAPEEAEAYCAILNRKELIDGVVAEDMDVLPFGAKVLLRNFFPSLTKNEDVLEISQEILLKSTQLTQEHFIDLCVLLGCDYCKSPKGVGPKRAIELIEKYKSIDKLISVKKLEDTWIYQPARNYFLSQLQISSISPLPLPSPPNKETLTNYLVEKNGFNKEKVLNAVKRLEKVEKASKQKPLTHFLRKTN
ncbi:flap endonuclease-1 [Nematocida sp. LUAm3]|nr:flap endonuclease-1 [Nematocida sp. LUAm3]KAI5175981.1 flap endonuclease-1 [Nematocida sp. LUAm2]KAI5179077.1 flap endonuclease-1 [Nematocida sp. LUAm1]